MKADILICTIDSGIQSVTSVLLPENKNIRYIVSWQRSDSKEYIIPSSLNRPDVKVIQLCGRGLSKNRNNAIRYSTNDICIIADDDLRYDLDKVTELLNYYEQHPEVDLICYQGIWGKQYPDKAFNLRKKPKKYSISSAEISFRRKKIQGSIKYNELMGLGSEFSGAGEDDLFILDCLYNNLNCLYLPIKVFSHDHLSTGVRNGGSPRVVFARGVLERIYHPYLFIFYYIWFARSIKINHNVGFVPTLISLWKGGSFAKKNNMLKYSIDKLFDKN